MPKKTKNVKQGKRSPKINMLANYLVNESTREGGGPDAATNAEITRLMDAPGHEVGGKRKKAAPKSASKSSKARKKKKR